MNPLRKVVERKKAAERFLQGVGGKIGHEFTKPRKSGISLKEGMTMPFKIVAHMPKAMFSTPGLKKKK